MLGKKLKTFSAFILERADWNYSDHYKKYLGKIPGDETLISAIKELDDTVNRIENDYWYNRESRDFRYDHYAIDMKIHEWPDLDEWARLSGYAAEELEGDRSGLEDLMYRDWARFMEDTYEDYAEHYRDSFSWLKEIGVGGRSGGWLLLAPETDHNDIERHVEEVMDEYLMALDEISENPEIMNMLNDEDTERLAELGLVDMDQLELAKQIEEYRDNAVATIYGTIRELEKMEEDFGMVERDIEKFRENCKQDFYEWVQGKYED